MANGIVIQQFAIVSALAVILMCLVIVVMRRKAQREPSHEVPVVQVVVEKPGSMPLKRVQTAASVKPPEEQPTAPRPITKETATNAPPKNAVNAASSPSAPNPPVIVLTQGLTEEDRRQRILEDISANIRKSLIKPVPTYSPIQFPEAPRDSEYVRVKKQIITPHGQIRFSILKDSISLNMLAVFRRASLDWEKPEDLIGFLPSYLEPEVEILDDQVLLIGTPGHNEKLAIPIRSVDAESNYHNCFDFVSDVRTATNTPAVLRASDDDNELEVVSRGVITQPVFMNTVGRVHADVTLLARGLTEAKLLS